MRSLAMKLTLAFLLISLIGTALAAVFARQATRREFDRFLLEEARSDFIATASAYYETHGSWAGVYQFLSAIPPAQGVPPGQWQPEGAVQSPPIPFLLADQAGRVVVPGGYYQMGDLVPVSELQRGIPVEVGEQVVGTVLTPTFSPELDPREQQYMERTTRALFMAALGATVIALLVGAVLARSLTRPLREMTAAVRSIAKGELQQLVPVRSPDELGELAVAFNQMSASLSRANQLRRQMAADIAHDLRSPLTVISGYLESLRDGVLKPTPERFEVLSNETIHLQRLVEDLRTLSLADAGELTINRQPVPPGELLERQVAAYQNQAEARQVGIDVNIQPNLPEVSVDPERMMQVLGNLVSNALRYTPPGGTITLTSWQEGDNVVLEVRDTGAGIPPETLPHVFERFYRGDEARQQDGASGLGLAIAKAIVELHGGQITASSEGVGKGSVFTIKT